MWYVRITKTTSSSRAIQVVRYQGKRTIILKHIGSGRSDSEIALLKREAQDWIQKVSGQQSLFGGRFEGSGEVGKDTRILQLGKCQFLGVRYSFLNEKVKAILALLGFDENELGKLLLDLVQIRIVEPASKLRSRYLLEQFFGIRYTASDIYRGMTRFFLLKDRVEAILVKFAKTELNFNFHLVFYDVTTLYFESFTEDSFRRCGFSKDNKGSQPQILIGLMVNRDGFPISFEVFEGNKFEGHTLLPAILELKAKYRIVSLTVVADAAMISRDNITKLTDHQLNYIVGARLGNLSRNLIEEISRRLSRIDGKAIRLSTPHGYLICDFSLKRFHKDSRDLEKQLQKAEAILNDPSLAKKTKYLKYLTSAGKAKPKLKLNRKLIEKTRLLLGIKGYYTDLNQPKKRIIERYHDLWKIEKSFRIAKSDLRIRPVYHFKQETIKSHILICFMALSVLKYLEIKTGKPSSRIIELMMSVTDARLLNMVSDEEVTLRIEITDEVKKMLDAVGLPY